MVTEVNAFLQTERLILRPSELSDAADIQRLAGDWDVAKTTLNIPHPYEDGTAEDFIKRVEKAHEKGQDFTFTITLKTDNTFLGMIGIHGGAHERAEIGYWIGKPYWNNGYTTEAARRIVQFGFETLNLNRIQASYFTHNPASRRVMEKAGMTYEGTLRSYVIRENAHKNLRDYFDMGMCSILRAEWLAR